MSVITATAQELLAGDVVPGREFNFPTEISAEGNPDHVTHYC